MLGLHPAPSTTAVNSSAVNWLPWSVFTNAGVPYRARALLDHLGGMAGPQAEGHLVRKRFARSVLIRSPDPEMQ